MGEKRYHGDMEVSEKQGDQVAVAEPQVPAVNEHGMSMEQEMFCQLYTKNRELFGNATLSYAEAYDYRLDEFSDIAPVIGKNDKGNDILGVSPQRKAYNICSSLASRLLKTEKINARVQKLLNELLTQEFVDSELAKVVAQDRKPDAKIRAINEFNKVRGRHAPEKVDHGKLTIEILDYATKREAVEVVQEVPKDTPDEPVRSVQGEAIQNAEGVPEQLLQGVRETEIEIVEQGESVEIKSVREDAPKEVVEGNN